MPAASTFMPNRSMPPAPPLAQLYDATATPVGAVFAIGGGAIIGASSSGGFVTSDFFGNLQFFNGDGTTASAPLSFTRSAGLFSEGSIGVLLDGRVVTAE